MRQYGREKTRISFTLNGMLRLGRLKLLLLLRRVIVLEAAVQTAIWTVQHALALPMGEALLAADYVPLTAPLTDAVPVAGAGILI